MFSVTFNDTPNAVRPPRLSGCHLISSVLVRVSSCALHAFQSAAGNFYVRSYLFSVIFCVAVVFFAPMIGSGLGPGCMRQNIYFIAGAQCKLRVKCVRNK